MRSDGANALARAQRASLLRRAGLQNQEFIVKSSLVEYVDVSQLQQKSTDYRGKPLLEKLPLHQRARHSRSRWPIANREISPKILPPSRNTRTIWRRYPNGELDFSWAYGKLSEAVNKYALGIPLNEVDALAISSVFPVIRFANLPPDIVDLKATLAMREREQLCKMCSARLLQDLFGPDRTSY